MTAITNKPRQRIDPATVNGWGVDADPENDPTYPMRDRSQDDGPGMNWQRPTQQNPRVEILQSIEYNRRPAVMGTTSPPKGLSGAVRRTAFTYSESDWRHWLMLMGADRVSVVEGIIDDLSKGRFPNIPVEMGLRSEWEHNRAGLAKKAVVVAGVSLAIALLIKANRDRTPEPRRPLPRMPQHRR